jgi:U3 small nucleolar RNA-associated protein 14
MKKREEATYEEARQALEEYDDSLKKLEENNTEQNEDSIKVPGKRTFGPVKNTHEEFKKRRKFQDTENSSDSEYDSEPAQHLSNNEVTMKHDDIQLGNALLDDEPQNDLYKVIHSYLQVIVPCVLDNII